MATLTNAFNINGVIDTSKGVLENINDIATAAAAWVSYDTAQGLWAVVINRAASSVKSFNDSNIIGAINVSGSGINELYNKAIIEYPHKDLRDQADIIEISIPEADRYDRELENSLEMRFDLVNNPVQAQYIASVELKQSRLDKIIQFTSDYSAIGIKGGDLIDITMSMYGWTNKKFRVISVVESDTDEGVIQFSITALEYDESIYSTNGLVFEERSRKTQILPKLVNDDIKAEDNKSGLPLDLSDTAKAAGMLLAFNALTGKWEFSQGGPLTSIAGTSAVIKWAFTDGLDLDIRCRISYPDVGQNTVDDYVGWTGNPPNSTTQWPTSGTAFIIWGGDNTGTGQEAVGVNISGILSSYPSIPYVIIECRGNWYNTPGFNPVQLTATVYEGGTLASDGNFGFTNTGYTKARNIPGLNVYVDSNSTNEQALGDLMGYFVYYVADQTVQFRNDLTGL